MPTKNEQSRLGELDVENVRLKAGSRLTTERAEQVTTDVLEQRRRGDPGPPHAPLVPIATTMAGSPPQHGSSEDGGADVPVEGYQGMACDGAVR